MKESNKHKVLFIVQLPPPIHGVSVMNQYAVNNPFLKENYQIHILTLDFGQTLKDIGKIKLGKLIRMIRFLFKLCFELISFRPDLVYFTIMPTGKTFYRDAFISKIIKGF